MSGNATGFGECQNCGGSVERVGWDDLCFRCQESEKAELLGHEIDEEDEFPDGIPADSRADGGGRWRG